MVKDAYPLDEKNRNTLCQDTIQKEMENMKIAFQTIPKGEKPFQYVIFHMVFDIKMEDFHRQWQEAISPIHQTITYSSMVTRETVCIFLTMAALHNLEVKEEDMDSIRSRVWGRCW